MENRGTGHLSDFILASAGTIEGRILANLNETILSREVVLKKEQSPHLPHFIILQPQIHLRDSEFPIHPSQSPPTLYATT
jgi:hypothetical protein